MSIEYRIDDFLEVADVDAVMALVLNLSAEVIELRERVRSLEAGRTGVELDGLQERADEVVARLGMPLAAPQELL
jgi:hypothetical protein